MNERYLQLTNQNNRISIKKNLYRMQNSINWDFSGGSGDFTGKSKKGKDSLNYLIGTYNKQT